MVVRFLSGLRSLMMATNCTYFRFATSEGKTQGNSKSAFFSCTAMVVRCLSGFVVTIMTVTKLTFFSVQACKRVMESGSEEHSHKHASEGNVHNITV